MRRLIEASSNGSAQSEYTKKQQLGTWKRPQEERFYNGLSTLGPICQRILSRNPSHAVRWTFPLMRHRTISFTAWKRDSLVAPDEKCFDHSWISWMNQTRIPFNGTNLRLLMSRRHIQQRLRCSSWTQLMERTVTLIFCKLACDYEQCKSFLL